ncbi:MAG: oligosaccharide flippase family protein [Planctomycetales bacterium]|nr:oligosaccharide flippase family protein [Planctomycetales bacterium]
MSKPAPESSTPSLRKKVVSGTAWNVGGQVVAQLWRLFANLVIAQLVAPWVFGLMLIVTVVMITVQMLSDVGLRDTVIHNSRGDEPDFLNTVWTIQIIRGFVLWGIVAAAALPCAWIYDKPILALLLPAVGVSAALRGFCSVSMFTADRHILPHWTVITTLGSSIGGSIVSIVIAYFRRDVWALVIGQVVGNALFSIISYRFGNHRHRLTWDKDAAAAVSSFGRWVIPSSTLTILLQRGEPIVLGGLMPLGVLGIYSQGANLAKMWLTVYLQLTRSVMQPVYSKLRKDSIQDARSKVRKLRFAICGACIAGIWVMIGLCYWFFDLLYKDVYLDAYVYCQIVSFGLTLRVATDMGPVFQAHGLAHRHFWLVAVRVAATVLAMFLGYVFYDAFGLTEAYFGVVWGVALAPIVYYPVQSYMYRQIHMWFPDVDTLGMVPAVALVAGALIL